MSNDFFERPVINAPYTCPDQHWEMDSSGQPTQKILPFRRRADFITPIPKPKKRKGTGNQGQLLFDEGKGISSATQEYDHNAIINTIRQHVDEWRKLPNPEHWGVTPQTARLLQHWRHYEFNGVRPFFCQIEAVEVAIWLTEVASPKISKSVAGILEHLEKSNQEANPGLARIALKLATGAGKTTVMAMLIAWQTINAVRQPGSSKFTRGFLIVAPGLTIRDRLRVLQPNDPDSYYANRELVPADMLPDLGKAKIVITNYHAFKLRERLELSRGTRNLLQGRGTQLSTLETEGQMLQRVMPALMGMKNILVINDEAHHCYQQKPQPEHEVLTGEDKKEAEKNNEAARLWISGLRIVQRQLGIQRIFDLSATPFFLRGSGYAEGTLFPWTMSDFSLMDAIECGIVKLPRVPVADNIPNAEMPQFRNLWENISAKMPQKGRGKSEQLDPHLLPVLLQTAMEALYGHYEKTFRLWEQVGIKTAPCFIVVCNNTASSKLVYDYISGFYRTLEDGTQHLEQGKLELFRNFDEHGNPYPRPRTLLIDSEQLESGEALDDQFRSAAATEIELFRREMAERNSSHDGVFTDQELLREVMNTVGKPGRLGESVRCVVSVSMLTEGWDANTVTHILGTRAFGTQLLCEQVIGRALRRQSYQLNEQGTFPVEYADILGIPFDFTAAPVIAPPQKPRQTTQVCAVRPERNDLEIRFPRIIGYRIELQDEQVKAEFTDDSIYTLTPEIVGATLTQNSGIIGESVELTLKHTQDLRPSALIYKLAFHLLQKWRNSDEGLKTNLFNEFRFIVKQWLDTCLVCKGDTYPAQLEYKVLADQACERILAGITTAMSDQHPVRAIPDPYNPTGSTIHVNFMTAKTDLWETDARRCHINWVVLDSDWEAEFCRVAERHPRVLAYVKNHGLGLNVPYRSLGETRQYRPDFILLVDDGHGPDNPLHLVAEVKGYRREDAKDKKLAMETRWIPGVNNLKSYGRWAFAEFGDVYTMEVDFEAKVQAEFEKMLNSLTT